MKIKISYLPEEGTKAAQIERMLRAMLLVEKIRYSDRHPPYLHTYLTTEQPKRPGNA